MPDATRVRYRLQVPRLAPLLALLRLHDYCQHKVIRIGYPNHFTKYAPTENKLCQQTQLLGT